MAMHEDKCKKIQTQIFENIAPLYDGIVTLNEAVRLFSYLGEKEEIEDCLDQFIKNKIAKKIQTSHGIIYVFEEIALNFGKKWQNDVIELKKQGQELEKTVTVLKQKENHLEELNKIWADGWDKTDSIYSSLIFYISSVFFAQAKEKIIAEIEEKKRFISKCEQQSRERQQKLDSSYYNTLE
jgi:hypothetical protein